MKELKHKDKENAEKQSNSGIKSKLAASKDRKPQQSPAMQLKQASLASFWSPRSAQAQTSAASKTAKPSANSSSSVKQVAQLSGSSSMALKSASKSESVSISKEKETKQAKNSASAALPTIKSSKATAAQSTSKPVQSASKKPSGILAYLTVNTTATTTTSIGAVVAVTSTKSALAAGLYPLPPISEDTSPEVLSIAKAVVLGKVVKQVQSDCIDIDDDDSEKIISGDKGKASSNEQNDRSTSKTEIRTSKKSESENVGAEGMRLAQKFVENWSLHTKKIVESENVGGLIITDCWRCLNVNELMDLAMVVDFLQEFSKSIGSSTDAFLPGLKLGNSFCLENFLLSLHTPSIASTNELSQIYTSLIHQSHPHDRRRWQTLTTPIESRALLIHHLLTLSKSEFLVSIFTALPLPRVPPQAHSLVLTRLVINLIDSREFRDWFDEHVVSGAEGIRKARASLAKQRTDLRAEMRQIQKDVAGITIVATSNTADTVITAQVPTVSSPSAASVSTTTSYAGKSASPPPFSESLAVTSRLAEIDREITTIDSRDADLVRALDTHGSGMRMRRILGHDRDFRTYVWIDWGVIEPMKRRESSLVSVPIKRTFGILVFGVAPTAAAPVKKFRKGMKEETQSRPEMVWCIDSIDVLKKVIAGLNDRGERERELLTVLRERLKPYGLNVPPFPTNVGGSRKRVFDSLGSAEAEAVVDSGMAQFGAFVDKMQQEDVERPKNLDYVSHDYEDRVIDGVRERLKDLVSVVGCKQPNRREIAAIETRKIFIAAIVKIIVDAFGNDEADEVAERFDGVNNWSLFSVAIGFVVQDVKKGKLGKRIEKNMPEPVRELSKYVYDEDENVVGVKLAGVRGTRNSGGNVKPTKENSSKPPAKFSSQKVAMKPNSRLITHIRKSARATTAENKVAYDERSKSENENDDSESSENNDSSSSESDSTEEVDLPKIDNTRVTRNSRKRNADEIDSVDLITTKRMTRSRVNKEKEPDVIHKSALHSLRAARNERLSHR
ncbi:hypothetical protein HK100_000676 [Physocladia obscura]|uniref:Uncharacterized protein n=1 Tax=Physocladia obscura TaxID=109957 RepID=A0AAD5SYX8_9FUNG|nr:hypothetical protein HK100_000676 [Physocladia obscura]